MTVHLIRERSRQKIERELSPITRRVIAGSETAVRQTPARVEAAVRAGIQAERTAAWNLNLALMWWIFPVLSVVPGLGQLFQKRFQMAATLAGTFVFFVGFWILTIHSPASHASLLILPLLIAFSVHDAAEKSFPPVQAGFLRQLRSFRLLMMALFFTSLVIWMGLDGLQQRFDLMVVRPNAGETTGAPVLESGDALAFEDLAQSRPLQRGDLVLCGYAENDMENFGDSTMIGPNISCLVALAGDRVQSQNGQLLVNGRPIPTGWMPKAWVPPANYDAVVPEKSAWLGWVLFNWTVYGDAAEVTQADLMPPNFSLVEISQIDGRLRAVYNPPQRRRLVP